MNGKKVGNVDMPTAIKEKASTYSYGVSIREWVGKVLQFAREDTDRVTFAVKVGIALLLTSILILCGPTYRAFGDSIIWAIITVAIMFEYTVGATFQKGFNRALGSLFAGIFAVVVIEVAISSGQVAEPYVIGFSIFLVGAVTSFVKLWPSMVTYEYGFRVALFTYCMIILSGYKLGAPTKTAMDRLYSIAIGGLVAVLVNVLIWPIWAGEQLHRELVKHFDSVADALEECVTKYLREAEDGMEQPELDDTVADDFADEPAFKRLRATLGSSTKFDSLANWAKWEPPHGRFRRFFYPWAEYRKLGSVLRHCAYEVVALHGCLHSEIQAPYKLRVAFESEILEAANQAAELIRGLAEDIDEMSRRLHGDMLKTLHGSADRLQRSIELHSYLLTHDVSKTDDQAGRKVERASLTNNHDNVTRQQQQQRRICSWPSRDGENNTVSIRMKASETTAALSLATFTSLIIEFVARLDHLVDAVDELAKLANFKEEEEELPV